jgi:pimeloyl-ACP methyl ester carboxylesterase
VTVDHLPGDARCEQHVMHQMLGSRHPGVDADHAIVVYSGSASRPGILDGFCAHHADRGVDVWKLDARFSPEGWTEDVAAWGAHVAQTTRLPVFVVGSTRNAADIYRALQISDVFVGAVLIGDASPLVSPEPLDPSSRQNTKPVFFILGETDIDSWPEVAKAAAAAAGPVELHTLPYDVNGPMLSHPEACSDVVLEWCLRQLSNHLNPAWKFE